MSKSPEVGEGVQLKKSFGFPHGVAIIVGIMIGSGIFISPVGVLRYVNSFGLAMVVWALSGLFSLLGALCFAELGVTITRSGGEYVYIKTALGEYMGFLTLWIEFFVICAIPTAACSLIFGLYLLTPIYECVSPPDYALKLIAILVITGLVAINCANAAWAGRVQIAFTACKLTALGAIVLLGLVHIATGKVGHNFSDVFAGSTLTLGNLTLAFYHGFWSFGGWNYLNFIADEMRNPTKNLPRAICVSLLLVTGLYLLANVAYAAVLSTPEMLASPAVAITFADKTMRPVQWLMPVLVACSVFGAMNGGLLSISRVFYIGAVDKQLPAIVAMISYSNLTPLPSILLIGIASVVLICVGGIFDLIELLGFGFSFILALTLISLIKLRIMCPKMPRPIKLPLVIPVFLLAWSMVLIGVTVYQNTQKALMFLVVILCSMLVYVVCIVWQSKPTSFRRGMTQFNHLFQKIFLVVFPVD